jgi:hypothetical protein
MHSATALSPDITENLLPCHFCATKPVVECGSCVALHERLTLVLRTAIELPVVCIDVIRLTVSKPVTDMCQPVLGVFYHH